MKGFIMQKDFYFLSPVEVVKVTSNNLEEVAEWCGGSVLETESRRQKGKMDQYVHVPTPEGTKISWAFPGMFITKRLVNTMKNELRETYAVFRRDYFDKNYFATIEAAVDKTWERAERERNRPKKVEVVVSNNVGEALVEAQKRIKDLEAKLDAAREEESEVELTEVLPGFPAHVHSITQTPTPMKMTGKVKKVQPTDAEVEEAKKVDEESLHDGADPFPEGCPEWKHLHVIADGCDKHDCTTDRYVDGLHIFTDVYAYCEPENKPVITPNPQFDANTTTG